MKWTQSVKWVVVVFQKGTPYLKRVPMSKQNFWKFLGKLGIYEYVR